MIKGYSSNTIMIMDMSFALMITVISNALLFATVMKNYNAETEKVRDYLNRLERSQRPVASRNHRPSEGRGGQERGGGPVALSGHP